MNYNPIRRVVASFGLQVEHMTRKATLPDLDYLVREYGSGRTAKDLARQCGVSRNVIYRALVAGGANMRKGGFVPTVSAFDPADVLAMFDSGIGSVGISKRTGATIREVNATLVANGRQPRSRSEQQLARMAAASPSERKALAAAAHAAVRGRKASPEELVKRANRRARVVSDYEVQLSSMLTQRGVQHGTQTPVGPYNCDLSIGAVAVEVWGGHWHWAGSHIAGCEERFRYIMDRGWHILVVAVSSSSPLTPAVADYVVSYCERANADPSAVREYRVIWRAGEDSTGGRADSADFSVEPPFGHARDAANGRYKRVPREAVHV